MQPQLTGQPWFDVLQDEFKLPYFLELKETLRKEYATVKCYPAPTKIFKAFELTDPKEIKVIILLQD